MKYIYLLEKFYQAVHNDTVIVPAIAFTHHEIDFINKYVCYWFDIYTELTYQSVGKMKRNFPANYLTEETNNYQLMMYFNYEAELLGKICACLDNEYKLRYCPELLDDRNRELLSTSVFETADEWKEINNPVRAHAMFTLLKKLRGLLDIAKDSESIIQSK